MGSVAKTIRIALGLQDPEDGRWATGQPRFPDVTVTGSDGKSVVVDTKFDRPSGGRDSWGEEKGKYTGQTQREDYNDMNEQETGKKDQDLSLDPDVCKCAEDPAPVEEVDPALAPVPFMPFVEGPIPSMPGIRIPLPEFPVPVLP
jgi:hypothetical protein